MRQYLWRMGSSVLVLIFSEHTFILLQFHQHQEKPHGKNSSLLTINLQILHSFLFVAFSSCWWNQHKGPLYHPQSSRLQLLNLSLQWSLETNVRTQELQALQKPRCWGKILTVGPGSPHWGAEVYYFEVLCTLNVMMDKTNGYAPQAQQESKIH